MNSKILLICFLLTSVNASGREVQELVLPQENSSQTGLEQPDISQSELDQEVIGDGYPNPRLINPSDFDNRPRSDAFFKPNRIMLKTIVKNSKQSSNFLLFNELKPGVIKLTNGVQYKVLVKGEGKTLPQENDIIRCQYQGRLMDGGVFETSGKQDVEVRVAPLIPGLKSAIKLMPVGSKWEIYIPPHLGFGQLGKPPKVGPDMVLIYEVSLLGIRNINEKDKVIKRSSESAGEERSVNSQLNEKNELSNSKKIKRKSKLVGQ